MKINIYKDLRPYFGDYQLHADYYSDPGRFAIMWIKTTAGALLNSDRAETIEYDPDYDFTRAWIGSNYCVIAEGDVVPLITSAIIKNQNYLGVQ